MKLLGRDLRLFRCRLVFIGDRFLVNSCVAFEGDDPRSALPLCLFFGVCYDSAFLKPFIDTKIACQIFCLT